ncbi:MAG: class I SAM-dependent methyltransferase, partial [Pyrinomonadaceae bacterium]
MKTDTDAYGKMLLAQLERGVPTCEIIERDDRYIDTGSEPGMYFSEYKYWDKKEKDALKYARGRTLDIGCGAGRHSLHLQAKGLDVTGIDASAGAIKVCKLRGLKKAMQRPIDEMSKFKRASFDTVVMLGNNFGLFGNPHRARKLLGELDRITTRESRIIVGTRNPYNTDHPDHLRYHKLNKSRDRMAGQIRMRCRFGSVIGEWFDYLFVSPSEMEY